MNTINIFVIIMFNLAIFINTREGMAHYTGQLLVNIVLIIIIIIIISIFIVVNIIIFVIIIIIVSSHLSGTMLLSGFLVYVLPW